MGLPAAARDVLGKDLLAALEEIRRRADQATKRESLLEFTDHTISHLDQVATNFLVLAGISRDTASQLNEFEFFVGLVGCYLHDVALQSTIQSKKDLTRVEAYDRVVQRNQHGVAASYWIMAELEGTTPAPPPLGTGYNDTVKRLCKIAAPLCKYHCSEPPENPLPNKKLLNQELRCQLLLGLLRLADALHLDFNRVKMENLRQHKIPVESEMHWWRHHYTDAVTIDPTGLIEITMSFPRLSRPIQDFFKTQTYDYIQLELGRFKKLFRENRITADLLAISIDDSWDQTKLPPSDELLAWMDDKIQPQESDYKSNPKPKSTPGRKKTRSFAFENWNVDGHPWADIPTSCTSLEFVDTESLKSYRDHVRRFLESATGEMRMVYGTRGVGKTTFLNSIRDEFGGEADVAYLDMSIVFGSLESVGKLYSWMFSRLNEKLGYSGPPPETKDLSRHLQETLADHDRPVIVLIDNLDRYVKDPDLETIKRFFEIAQGPLQDLKQKATILITAHENWKQFVQDEDLSYIGAAPSWTLEALTAVEIRELLDKRLQIAGSSYDRVFSPDAYLKIHRISGGNPRYAIGDCAYLFEDAIRRQVTVIDDAFIREYHQNDLESRLHATVMSLANRSPVVEKTLDAAAGFYDALEQSPHSQEYAWELLESLMTRGELPLNSVPEDIRPAFSLVAEMTNVGSMLAWKPSQPLKRALDLLSKEGVSRAEFFHHFKVRPIRPAGARKESFIPRMRPQLPSSLGKLEKLAYSAYGRYEAEQDRRKAARYLRYWVEYWMVLMARSLRIATPDDYIEHEMGSVMVDGKMVQKKPWEHKRDFRDLVHVLLRSKTRFQALASMRLVGDNSEKVFDQKPWHPSADEIELIHLAGKQVFAEACVLLQRR